MDIGMTINIVSKLVSLGMLMKNQTVEGITYDFLKERKLLAEFVDYSEKKRMSEIKRIVESLTETEIDWITTHIDDLKGLIEPNEKKGMVELRKVTK